VDFDSDGTPDLLSGSWPGELYFFKGLGKGKFAKAETLKDKDGKVIKLGSASTVFACDWRGSGKLDLLVGDIGGSVWLVPNEGTRSKPAYGKAVKLQAAGKDIMAPHGDSHPVMADWDGSGKPGLVVGCGDGSVLWFKNIGSRTAPKLAAGQMLVAAPPPQNFNDPKPSKETTRGTRAKVWVGDWNGDGRLDLLVGDFSMTYGENPKLTEADKKLQKETEEKLTRLHKELEPYSRELARIFEKGRKRGQTAASDAERAQEQKELEALAKKYQDKLNERGKLYETLRKFQRPYFYHGHVWLFARQGAEKTSSR
jgi:hypothetical protein